MTDVANVCRPSTQGRFFTQKCVFVWVDHFCGVSAGPIPYVVTTEMFRQSARPAAFMVAGSVHWLSNFTVGLVFPFMEVGVTSFSGTYRYLIFILRVGGQLLDRKDTPSSN